MVQSRDSHFDLIIRAGRIVCPDSGMDGPGRVALRGERIAAVEPSSIVKVDPANADRYFDLSANRFGVSDQWHVDISKYQRSRGLCTLSLHRYLRRLATKVLGQGIGDRGNAGVLLIWRVSQV